MKRQTTGFTLIELVFVMLLLALLMSVAVPAVTNVFGINLRTGATNFTGYLRASREEAIMKQKRLRVRIELGSGKYWVESFEPEPMVPLLTEETKLDEAMQAFEERAQQDPLTEEELQEKKEKEFKALNSGLLKVSSLPRGIRFKGVYFSNEGKVLESGVSSIPFSSNGYAPKTIVYLANDVGTVTSIILQPLAGRSRIEKGEVRPNDV